MTSCRTHSEHHDPAGMPFDHGKREASVDNAVSGYIRYVDTKRLLQPREGFQAARAHAPPRRTFRAGGS